MGDGPGAAQGGRLGGVEVAVAGGEIAAGQLDADAVAGPELIGGVADAEFVADGFAWGEKIAAEHAVAMAGADQAGGQLALGTVGRHVGQAAGKVGIRHVGGGVECDADDTGQSERRFQRGRLELEHIGSGGDG